MSAESKVAAPKGAGGGVAEFDFPIPKYRKGEKVWYAYTTTKGAQHPCPDCLGTKKWSCTSPAGHTMEVACPRCDRNVYDDALNLSYTKHTFGVRSLTIGSIKIDTDSACGEHPVSYMCEETGIGSGSLYRENNLFATREEAEVVYMALAAARQDEADAQPAAIKRLEYARRPYFHALKIAASDEAMQELRRTLAVEQVPGAPTAGNWCVENGYSDDHYRVVARELGLPYGDVTVAEVSGSDSYGHMPAASQALPNALLIAAAPELLAELQRALDWIEDSVSRNPPAYEQDSPPLEPGRAVLAKAGGSL